MNAPSLPRLLLNGFQWFDDALRQSFAAQGLPKFTHSQSLVMSSLKSEGISISELARRLEMTRQGAQKSVAGLEMDGLVYSEVDPTNSSAKIVRLTKRGFQTIETAQEIFKALEVELAARIGEKRVAALRDALGQNWNDPPIV